MNLFPGSDLVIGGIFIIIVATTVAGALIAALTKRVIRSVCGLALCCIGLAGLYYFLNSPFLALMEILIYVGAVCVTIVFAIMLSEPEEVVETDSRGSFALWGGGGLVVSALLFWSLARLGVLGEWTTPAIRASDGSVQAIGIALLTTYSMAFELISLVLFVAILGALVIARGGRTKS